MRRAKPASCLVNPGNLDWSATVFSPAPSFFGVWALDLWPWLRSALSRNKTPVRVSDLWRKQGHVQKKSTKKISQTVEAFEISAMSWRARRCEARGDAGSALASLRARCLRFTNSLRSSEHQTCVWCSFGRMLEVAWDVRRAPPCHLWPSAVKR